MTIEAQAVPGGLIVVGGDIIMQCSYCGAFKTDLGYRGRGPLVSKVGRYRVSHGACEPCYDIEMARIRREMGH